MTTYTASILGVPIGKGRPRACVAGGRARMYTPKKTADWELSAAGCFLAQIGRLGLSGPLRLSVVATFPRPQRLLRRSSPRERIPHVAKPDADNVLKAVCDALQKAGVLADDATIYDAWSRKFYVAIGELPCVLVALRDDTAAHASNLTSIQTMEQP